MDQLVRSRGRPRNTDLDVKIREAAWLFIARMGCAALTFEAIAQYAGCSRSSLYRRFANKAELILDLLDETALSFQPFFTADTPPRDRLIAHVRICITMYKGDRGVAFMQIMAASRSDPAIFEAIRAHGRLIVPHYFEPLRQLAPQADQEAIAFAFHTLIGSIMHHVAGRAHPPSEYQTEQLVDAAIYLAKGC